MATELTSQLERGFSAITTLIDRLMNEVKGKSETLVRLSTEFQYLQRAVRQLEEIVIEGNGERPLTTRMSNLEQSIGLIQRDVEKNASFRKNVNLSIGIAVLGGVLSWIPILISFLRG